MLRFVAIDLELTGSARSDHFSFEDAYRRALSIGIIEGSKKIILKGPQRVVLRVFEVPLVPLLFRA